MIKKLSYAKQLKAKAARFEIKFRGESVLISKRCCVLCFVSSALTLKTVFPRRASRQSRSDKAHLRDEAALKGNMVIFQ